MKNLILFTIVVCFTLVACTTKDKYSASQYYSKAEQDSVLASIITYVFIAPTYVSMSDRFQTKHRSFYTSPQVLSQFSIDKFYVAEDGTNYFYLLRTAPHEGEKRGVGGYFKMDNKYTLSGFREIYVTPILPIVEVRKRGEFLFDKLVKGEVGEYLKMKSYVQWPNPASYYDTTKYEWVLNSAALDTLGIN